MKRVCVAFGTRPEASKMAPVIFALQAQRGLEPQILVTGQHREQLAQMLDIFGLRPDADLEVMRERQRLPELLGRIVPAAAAKLRDLKPDYLLVHGDTLSTFAVALAAFYEGVPVGHVEAGLRSFDLAEPFPEEANRRLTDVLTDIDLPPTTWAKGNLLAEGKAAEQMVVTGNTAVDAVRRALKQAQLPAYLDRDKLILMTMHRRENLPLMADLAKAIAKVVKARPDVTLAYAVHLNPAVREAVYPAMQDVPNIILDEPYDYLTMLAAMRRADFILTDSGGLQEEGAALGVPVLVLRNLTERPEGVEAGVLQLIGNEPLSVGASLEQTLSDSHVLAAMRGRPNPYGDGRAGERVAQAVAWRLGLAERPEDWQL